EILRENYDSVKAMERLNEALERIDSSFQFALSGREADARSGYEANWKMFEDHLRAEQKNITIYPQEPELVRRLEEQRSRYRQRGDRFFARRPGDPARTEDYFGAGEEDPGLLRQFTALKETSGAILRLNQEQMEKASRDAQAMAHWSLLGFGG